MAQNRKNHIFKDVAELSKFCGKFITDLASKAIAERGIFTLGKLLV